MQPTYYGVPAIHKPHWKWLIIAYFFLGGIAGGSYLTAAISSRFGPTADRSLVRAGRYLSLAALLPCPPLLILDLGRPERFLYMLRVLKLRSPMSTGTWGILLFSLFSSAAAAGQAAEDGVLGNGRLNEGCRRLPLRAIGTAGAPLALFVSGYTGVLLAATAVPLWTKRASLLGPLFLASAVSTSCAALSVALTLGSGTRRETEHRLERLETMAIVAELGLLATWIIRLGPTASPLRAGRTGRLVRHGLVKGGLLTPLALATVGHFLPRRMKRVARLTSSALVLAGGLVLRYAVVVGGHASADDPRATFDLARRDDASSSPL